MEDKIYISPEDIEILDAGEYSTDLSEHFETVPDVAKPLLNGAKSAFKRIEQMLYSAPAFINAVRASLPQETMQAPGECVNTLGVAARNAAGVDTKLNPQLPTNYWQGVIAATSRSSAEIICAKLFSGGSDGFNDGYEVGDMNTSIQKFLSYQTTTENEDEELKNTQEFLNYCGLVATVAITLPDEERESVAKKLDNMCANYFQGKGFTPLLIVGEITYPSWWNGTSAKIEECNNWWTPKVALGGQTGVGWNNTLISNNEKSAVRLYSICDTIQR